jgi:hypothetical protein
MAKKAAKKTGYTATANILGKKYTATAPSAHEAIAAINPGVARGKCILSVTNGETTRERILMPMAVQKLFNMKGISRAVALKHTSILFDF